MATLRRALLAVLILVVTGMLNPARSDVDLNGSWVATAPLFPVTECLNFVQSGTALTATPCNEAGPAYTGTIDPATGAFDISQPPLCSPSSQSRSLQVLSRHRSEEPAVRQGDDEYLGPVDE
jgi:hypothetical protein